MIISRLTVRSAHASRELWVVQLGWAIAKISAAELAVMTRIVLKPHDLCITDAAASICTITHKNAAEHSCE